MYEQADELQGTALDVWLAQHERAGHAQLPALRRMQIGRASCRERV